MKIVPSHPNGEPIDPEFTKFHRFYNGQDLIVFDDFFDYATYFNLIPKEINTDDNPPQDPTV